MKKAIKNAPQVGDQDRGISKILPVNNNIKQPCLVRVYTRKVKASDLKNAARYNPPRDQCFLCGTKLNLRNGTSSVKPVGLITAERFILPIIGEKPRKVVIKGLVCACCTTNEKSNSKLTDFLIQIGFIDSVGVIIDG